jgi:hypothetical protein
LQLQKQLELVAMAKTVGQEGNRNTAKLDEEVGEKLKGVTRRSPACLGKSEEDRSGRISPETGDEEVDVVVAVVVPSSIP